jgi:hypothetical protein
MVLKIKNKNKSKVVNKNKTTKNKSKSKNKNKNKNKNIINVKVNISNTKGIKEDDEVKDVIKQKQPYTLPSNLTMGGLIQRQPQRVDVSSGVITKADNTNTTGLNKSSKIIPKREKNNVVDIPVNNLKSKDRLKLSMFAEDNKGNMDGVDVVYIVKGKTFFSEMDAQQYADRKGIEKDIKRVIMPPDTPKETSISSERPDLETVNEYSAPNLTPNQTMYAPFTQQEPPLPIETIEDTEPAEPIEILEEELEDEPVEEEPVAPEIVESEIVEPEIVEPEIVEAEIVEPELKRASFNAILNRDNDNLKSAILNHINQYPINNDERLYFVVEDEENNNVFFSFNKNDVKKKTKDLKDQVYFYIKGKSINRYLDNQEEELLSNIDNVIESSPLKETPVFNAPNLEPVKKFDSPELGEPSNTISQEKLDEEKKKAMSIGDIKKGLIADRNDKDDEFETLLTSTQNDYTILDTDNQNIICPFKDCNAGENGGKKTYNYSEKKLTKAYKKMIGHINTYHKNDDEAERKNFLNILNDAYRTAEKKPLRTIKE